MKPFKSGDIFWRPSQGIESPVWLFISDTDTRLIKSSTNFSLEELRTIHGSVPAKQYALDESYSVICNIIDVDSWLKIQKRLLEK